MRIAAFMGDGIGPEIVGAALEALSAVQAAHRLELEIAVHPVGLSALSEFGTTFPEHSRSAAVEADGIILGPLATSDYPPQNAGGINASAVLRRDLDLYANIRPCRSFQAVPAKSPSMDLIVVRENTEGFYANRAMHAGSGEFAPDSDTAFSLRRITAKCSRRIAERAFELARKRRKQVIAVHKANALPLTEGLFLRECRAVGKNNPDIRYQELLVDNVASRLVADDGSLDVLVTTNLFGDILSNEAAALSGGLGLGASINHGDRHAMAQASHGAAPDIAGRGIANPVAMLLSVALLLRRLAVSHGPELIDAASALEAAVEATLAVSNTRTPDLGGTATTRHCASSVIRSLDPHRGRGVRDTAMRTGRARGLSCIS